MIGGKRTVNDDGLVVDPISVVLATDNGVEGVGEFSFERRKSLVYFNPVTTQAFNAERNKFISAISYLIPMIHQMYD